MKVYARHVTLEELKQTCDQRGFSLSTTLHETKGFDHVSFLARFDNVRVIVLYDPVFGRFLGRTKNLETPLDFCQLSALEHETWFAELLDFLYREPLCLVPSPAHFR